MATERISAETVRNAKREAEPSERTYQPVRGENVMLKITTVGGMIGLIVFVVAWAVNLQADVRNLQHDITTIKQAVTALDKMSQLESEISNLRKYGSESATQNAKEIAELKNRLDMHIALTSPKPTQ